MEIKTIQIRLDEALGTNISGSIGSTIDNSLDVAYTNNMGINNRVSRHPSIKYPQHLKGYRMVLFTDFGLLKNKDDVVIEGNFQNNLVDLKDEVVKYFLRYTGKQPNFEPFDMKSKDGYIYNFSYVDGKIILK